jgi:hypothetical protein
MINKQLPQVRKVEQVWQPKAWLDINEDLTLASPSFGPGTYSQVGKQVLQKGLLFPTGDQTADLLYAAYCIPEVNDLEEFKEVRDIVRDRLLLVGARDFWTPAGKSNHGVYVLQDPRAIGMSENLTQDRLETLLKGAEEYRVQDGKNGIIRLHPENQIAFAPQETIQLGYFENHNSLKKNGLIIATYLPKKVEKLVEVSSKFTNKPYVWGLDISEGQNPEQRLSAVGGYGGRLGLGGDWVNDEISHAFGVSPSSK